jgi:hypothetical protein
MNQPGLRKPANFIEHHDLGTVVGCRAAQEALTQALEQIDRALDELRNWTNQLDRAQRALAEQLALPEIKDLLVQDRIPWRIMTIARALHEAAMELAAGDWVKVGCAKNWIADRCPEEQPEAYGCRTWQKVIHETGMIDLKSHKLDGRWVSWYRPRKHAPIPATPSVLKSQ